MNEAKYKQQDVQFDKLIEYVLDIVKLEIADKVEDELKSQSEVKEESQIKEDEGAGMKVKQEKEEKFTHVKGVNTSPPEDTRQVNDEDLKKEEENFQDEEHKHLERAKDNDNKIVDIGDENAEQSCNMSSTGSKEPTQRDPDDEKTGFNTRNKVVLEEEEEEEDDDDDDEGFMPRKLFFFSFSEFKKEETSA